MAQIITYPKLSTLANNDLLIVSDVSSKNKNTNSVELQTLANFIVTSTSGITGSGTLNTIAMFTPDGQSIGDSQLQQSSQLSNGLYQMKFDNADRFIINKPSSVTSGDPEYLIQQDGNFKVSFGWDDDGGGFGYIYNWAGNGLRLGAAGQNPQLELDTAAPKIISHTDHEFEQGILDRNGSSGINGQVLTVSGSSKIEWTDIADISGSVTGSGTTNTLPVWTDGPNGVLGDSMITQNLSGTIANVTGRLAVDADLSVNGYARFSGQVQDGTNSPGTNGQVLTSNVSGVEWNDATDVVSGAVAKLIPFNITASPGGSSVYNADNNIVEISWTTGNGIYVLILPTATGSNAYRNIRFVTNGTFPGGASHKIEITALPGETVDGAGVFEISKTYEGVSLWSNGTEWIVIQAKAH